MGEGRPWYPYDFEEGEGFDTLRDPIARAAWEADQARMRSEIEFAKEPKTYLNQFNMPFSKRLELLLARVREERLTREQMKGKQ